MALEHVFGQLSAIMLPYTRRLRAVETSALRLSVETAHVQRNGKPLWFGGVELKKNYVSYHLMPLYLNARLLEKVSPALRRRMQGKSCFNFKTVDDSLFHELAGLTEAAFRDYEERGLLE